MQQTQAQRHEEKIIFAAFYELQPDFAGEPIEDWKLADCDPPDIVCTAVSGKRIGVELGEWLHFGEMEAGKLREAMERQLLDAIGEPQPLNTSRHFDMVILHPRDLVRITTSPGKASFRAAMISLIADVDRRWPAERSWHYAPGCRIKDLSNWPPLDRYLESVHFHPGQSQRTEGIKWDPSGRSCVHLRQHDDDHALGVPALREDSEVPHAANGDSLRRIRAVGLLQSGSDVQPSDPNAKENGRDGRRRSPQGITPRLRTIFDRLPFPGPNSRGASFSALVTAIGSCT
jgi:hypothetical protein